MWCSLIEFTNTAAYRPLYVTLCYMENTYKKISRDLPVSRPSAEPCLSVPVWCSIGPFPPGHLFWWSSCCQRATLGSRCMLPLLSIPTTRTETQPHTTHQSGQWKTCLTDIKRKGYHVAATISPVNILICFKQVLLVPLMWSYRKINVFNIWSLRACVYNHTSLLHSSVL